MADRIVAAVRMKRKVLEGVDQQSDIIDILDNFVRKTIFREPDRETRKLKRELVALMRKKYLPRADESGRRSAVPILDRIGGDAAVAKGARLSGRPLRYLSGFRQANIKWFAQEVETSTVAISSELKAQLAKASRDSIARADMISDVIDSYKAELKQTRKARRVLEQANKALANAEATGDLKAIKAARKARSKAKSAAHNVKTAMGRMETRVQGAARDAVRRETQRAQLATYRQAGYTVYTWVAVNGAAACDSCTALHGTTRSLKEWQGNQPGDGHTYCGGSCMCELVPQEFTKDNESIKEPVNPYLFDALEK
ncbi:MAG: hypothetical protein GY807_18920 [Gammaproteobacteria bacterium]|nr:hypothetical protein [Gammaproteobacteria bacterium]